VTAVIEIQELGKRYRRLWALSECTLSVPAGHVVGLVGPNGAGKSTLLNLAAGLLAPTTGTIQVLGGRPPAGPAELARVGFLAQDAPVYAGLTVTEHLTLGARLNPGWDAEFARGRIDWLGLDPGQKAGQLSGGQRAQLVLVGSRVRVAGPVDELLATHHLLTGPRRDPATLPAGQQVISASHTDRQTTLLIRTSEPVLDPAWTVSEVALEDLVLAYMRQAAGGGRRRVPGNQLEVGQ
jgi:ABC-2 type transport system ATP-binding protein